MTFTKEGSVWKATMTMDTPIAVHITRADKGYFTVYGQIGTLRPVSVFCQTERQDLLFDLSLPKGMKVVFESHTEVLGAQTLAIE